MSKEDSEDQNETEVKTPIPTGFAKQRSILRPAERDVLWGKGTYPSIENPPKEERKHGRDEASADRGIRELTDEFDAIFGQLRSDLLTLLRYNDLDEFQGTLSEPSTYRQLKALRDLLDNWVEYAEDENTDRLELQEGLSKLHEEINLCQYEEIENEEVEKRKEGLVAVLRKKGLVDLIERLYAEDLREPGLNGKEKKLFTRWLENKLSLAQTKGDRWDKEYKLTDRGKAVYEAWEHLKETKAVKKRNKSWRERHQIVYKLLDSEFNAGEWTDILSTSKEMKERDDVNTSSTDNEEDDGIKYEDSYPTEPSQPTWKLLREWTDIDDED